MSYDGNYRPDHPGGRLVNYRHSADRRQSAAANKLLEAITNVDSNVIELANALVNTGSPAVRGRLMDFVVAVIFAQADAFVAEGDTSDGPSNGYLLAEQLNNFGIMPKP